MAVAKPPKKVSGVASMGQAKHKTFRRKVGCLYKRNLYLYMAVSSTKHVIMLYILKEIHIVEL